MKKNIFSFFVSLCIFIILGNSIASANHYRWLVLDSKQQLGGGGYGGKNYLNIYVVDGGAWWDYDIPTNSTIKTEIGRAITAWKNAVPFYELDDRDSVGELTIEQYSDSTCGSTAAGCYIVNSMIRISDHNVGYVYEASIYVKNTYTGDNAQRIVLHELGHALGLHEAYVDNSTTGTSCNSSLSSVMDAIGCESLLAPSSTDINDVNLMLQNGYATNLAYSWNTNTLNLTWKDNSLGEYSYKVNYYKVSSTGSLSLVQSSTVTKDIGLIKGITTSTGYVYSDRIITDTSFSKTGKNAGKYRAIVYPYFKNTGKNGTSVSIDFTI
jgi:hypothetical protein